MAVRVGIFCSPFTGFVIQSASARHYSLAAFTDRHAYSTTVTIFAIVYVRFVRVVCCWCCCSQLNHCLVPLTEFNFDFHDKEKNKHWNKVHISNMRRYNILLGMSCYFCHFSFARFLFQSIAILSPHQCFYFN